MILIISSNEDKATESVIDWLRCKNKPFLRINESDKVLVELATLKNTSTSVLLHHIDAFGKKTIFDLDQISSVWYRRGKLNLHWLPIDKNEFPDHQNIIYYTNRYLYREKQILEDFIYSILEEKKHINKYDDIKTNKLINLLVASRHGIKIPETYVSSLSKKLQSLSNESDGAITKALHMGFITLDKLDHLAIYGMTHMLEPSSFQHTAEEVFPSLLQKYIDKSYELRIFFLDNKFYSSAIFSQNDDQTKVDFRNYNFKKLNRVVPYKLPESLKKKLYNLMTDLKLNSGSIDMLVTKSMDYIFLEVNPIGQFEQVSTPCNYFLEEAIAQHLT